MFKSRTQKAVLNTTTAAISEVVVLICGLILPRLILANYGGAYNGISSSATQFLSAVSILTIGIAGATRVALYKTLAKGDVEGSSSIVNATEKYMRKVGIVLAIYIGVLAVVYPLLVDTGYSWIEVSPLILAAGIGTFGQYFFGTAYTAFLTADQSVYITNIFTIITILANTIVSFFLIRIHCTIQTVRIVSSFLFFLQPFLLRLYVTRKYTLNRKSTPDNSIMETRKDVMAHSIANIVHDNTDIIVLTVFCNVKIVSVYTVYNLVMNALKKLQIVFTNGTEALFGDMWAKKEYDKIRSLLNNYEFIITSIISTVFATALVMIIPFIMIYTKGVHDVEYRLPVYAAVITSAQAWYCMRSPYLTLVQGSGHYKETKTGAYLEAGINLVTSVVLVQFVGIVGVAIGTLLANIFRTVQYAIFIDNHIVSRGKIVFVKRIIWTVINVLLTFFLASIYMQRITIGNWFIWIVCGCVTFLLSCVVTLGASVLWYRADLKQAMNIIRRVINKKR